MNPRGGDQFLDDGEILDEFAAEDADLVPALLALRKSPSMALRQRVLAIPKSDGLAADSGLLDAEADERSDELLAWTVADEAVSSDPRKDGFSPSGSNGARKEGRAALPAGERRKPFFHRPASRGTLLITQVGAVVAVLVLVAGLAMTFRGVARLRGPEPARPLIHEGVRKAIATRSENVELASHLGGSPIALFVDGARAYVGIGAELAIFDVSTPAQPRKIGAVVLPHQVVDVTISGHYAYATTGASGLWVISVADHTDPVPVGTYDTPDFAAGVAVADGYAYVSDGTTLRIVDVSDPARPIEAGLYQAASHVSDFALAGDYTYLAAGSDGLRILDISDSTHPFEVGSYRSAPAHSVAVAGAYAYVASQNRGLGIVDITNPAVPRQVGFYERADDVAGVQVAVAGPYAYLAELAEAPSMMAAPPNLLPGAGRLSVIDVLDPTAPREAGVVLGGGHAVAVAAGHAYLASSTGVEILDLSEPAAPASVGRIRALGMATGVAIAGPYAYMLAGKQLHTIAIAGGTAPRAVGSLELPGTAFRIALSDGYAYVAAGEAGLRVVDLANPGAPLEVGAYDTPGATAQVVVDGQYAYLADYAGGFRIVEISNPAAPTETAHYVARGLVRDVAVEGDYAYVAWWDCNTGPNPCTSGVQILDISDRSAPVEVGVSSGYHMIEALDVAGDYAYLATGDEGLVILDISRRDAPALRGRYEGGWTQSVAVDDHYVYLGTADTLAVLDISDPAEPIKAGFYQTLSIIQDIAVAGENLYVVDLHGGLAILKLALPVPAATRTR